MYSKEILQNGTVVSPSIYVSDLVSAEIASSTSTSSFE
jgi:hypothetical protein